MGNVLRNIAVYIAGLALLAGCSSTEHISQVNLAHLYQQEGVVLKPMFYVYHLNETESRLYFQASSDQLLFKKADDDENKFIARFRASYTLYDSFEEGNIIDSGSTTFTEVKNNLQTKLIREYVLISVHRQHPNSTTLS